MIEKLFHITTDALLTVVYYIVLWAVCMAIVAKFLIY